MDQLDGVPCRVLGHRITTRTQICLNCLIAACCELLLYLGVMTIDIALSVQHFLDGNRLFGSLTISFVCAPAVACFCAVIVSPDQWPQQEFSHCDKKNVLFFLKQLYNLFLFPIAAIIRLARRVFWSIEALFHERGTCERQHAVAKAAEHSSFELYHFLQAFLHSAPQIILQFSIVLRENIFRNYETTHLQVASIIFSLIVLAVITETYQRFESQKVVGRNYPWTSKHQAKRRWEKFANVNRATAEFLRPTKQSYVELFPSDSIMSKIKSIDKINDDNNSDKTVFDSNDNNVQVVTPMTEQYKSLHLGEFNVNKNLDTSTPTSEQKEFNLPNDMGQDVVDRENQNIQIRRKMNLNIENADEILPYNKDDSNETLNFLDASPDVPAPPLPKSPPLNLNLIINRMSKFKDMFVFNTELYIREHVPRLPESLFPPLDEKPDEDQELNGNKNIKNNSKIYNNDNDDNSKRRSNSSKHTTENPPTTSAAATATSAPATSSDDTDFMLPLPTRKKMIEGIEQEDFVGKSVALTAWILFLFMRMMALSAFFVFHPWECAYLCVGHYLLMMCCLFYETKLHEKIERTYFYLFLAYVYIFTIMEFKIKFKRPRKWYISYITLMVIENLTITFLWYFAGNFESWWYEYIFTAIMLSLFYTIMCLLVYYFLLKPPDKVLFDEGDE